MVSRFSSVVHAKQSCWQLLVMHWSNVFQELLKQSWSFKRGHRRLVHYSLTQVREQLVALFMCVFEGGLGCQKEEAGSRITDVCSI